VTMSFEEFRAKLADEVTCWINRTPGRITACHGGPYDCCPLGTRTSNENSHPGSYVAAAHWGIEWIEACSFIQGFDGIHPASAPDEFFRLGQAYRRRFVEGIRR
jgi:hypothetical protein